MRLFFSSFHSLRPARTTSRLRKKADSRRDRDRGPFPLDFPVPQFCSANVARQIALYARMPRMQSTATSSFPWINADCCQASCRRRSEVIIECIRRRNTDIMRARIILLSVLLVCTSVSTNFLANLSRRKSEENLRIPHNLDIYCKSQMVHKSPFVVVLSVFQMQIFCF